jgi:hypothetical protein
MGKCRDPNCVINPTNKGRKNENRKGEAVVRAKQQREKQKERGDEATDI